MKVSIITTCYNRVNTIADTIESVLRQEYDDIEYIIIDGNSTDGSMDVINRYKDKIHVIISESDTGMYEAINKGIRLATGDIIGLAHSDDILYDSLVIGEIARKFEATNADLVYCDGMYVLPNDLDHKVRCWKGGSYSRLKVRFGWLPLHTTVFIKREIMNRYGLYDESYRIASDTDLLIRYLYQKEIKVAYLNRYTVTMRMGGLSTDMKYRKKTFQEDIKVFRHHGFWPFSFMKLLKMSWKVPQYIKASILNLTV